MKITFLGGGNMASALIGGLLNQGFSPEEMAVIEIGAENRARLVKAYGLRCYTKPEDQAMQCDALLLAVKPQQMREACASLQQYLNQQLVISIAAGLRLTGHFLEEHVFAHRPGGAPAARTRLVERLARRRP